MNNLPTLSNLPRDLPAFEANGNLPAGDFAPSQIHFESRLVTNKRRRSIYNGWTQWRRALLDAGLAPAARQLIDGSFASAKPEPGDLDVAVEVAIDGVESLRKPDARFRLLRGPEMKDEYQCDAYPIPILPQDDPAFERVTAELIRYWMKWFGTSRDGTAKGRVWAATGGLT